MDGQWKVGYSRAEHQVFLENTRLDSHRIWFFTQDEAKAIANALLEARNRLGEALPTRVYVATI